MIREAPDFEPYTRQSNCGNLICHSGRAWRVSAAALSDMTASQMRLHTAHSAAVIEPLASSLPEMPRLHWSTDMQHSGGEGITHLMLCQPTKPYWRWQLKLQALIRQLIKTLSHGIISASYFVLRSINLNPESKQMEKKSRALPVIMKIFRRRGERYINFPFWGFRCDLDRNPLCELNVWFLPQMKWGSPSHPVHQTLCHLYGAF